MRALLLLILLSFGGLYTSAASAKLNVFTCEPEWAALVQELGGDLLAISIATAATQDPHHIQARPSLIAKARKADLLICSGAELEVGWLPLLLRKASNPAIQAGAIGHFMATSVVPLLGQPEKLDRSEGDIHASGNPHIQTDPHRIAQVAIALKKRLTEIDPGNSQLYKQKYMDFAERWEAAISRWEKLSEPLKGKMIIANHDSWPYLAEWLSLDITTFLEPKPGIPPTTEHLSQLVAQAQQQSPVLIIYAAYEDPRAANWLSERTGIIALKLPITVGEAENSATLFTLFDQIIERMLGAMKK